MTHGERISSARAPANFRDGRGTARGRPQEDLWAGFRSPRIVILTAALSEYRAVRASLSQLRTAESASGAPYSVGSLAVRAGFWEVWAACIGQGNIGAALETSQAIQELKPELIAFVGTAGSLRDEVQLGDVVFATKVYGYESAKQTNDGLLGRPAIEMADRNTTQVAFRVAAEETWADRVSRPAGEPAPRAHIAPLAAGDKIHTGNRSELHRYLRSSFEDAHAVEMEGLGFLSGARFWPTDTKAVVVRGVSDRLADKDPVQDAALQPAACHNAMAFLSELLENLWPKADEFWRRLGSATVPGQPAMNASTFMALGSDGGSTVVRHEDIPELNLVGVVIDGRYRLLREIGRGALNVVWEAEEFAFGGSLGRVALKLQPPKNDKRFIYFTREATVMAGLDSPNLLPYRCAGVQAHGPLAGWSFIATALAELSLRDMVNEQPLQGAELARMLEDVAAGLDHLHTMRLVHGDVKPANILWLGHRWVIGDFGLTQKTGAHEPEGTVGYMAPERFKGLVTTKNDVYSFAVTAVVAASGLGRSEESTIANTFMRVMDFLHTNIPRSPHLKEHWFPPGVAPVLRQAMKRHPAERPTMKDILDTLRGAQILSDT
ncbi:protein kinase [Streptomyces sp. S3(2020)]|nr:protein kinase [Streptomyces sp. S3(2020)]NNN37463.1 protein kinase [Streptomyces sp. S3(2020)]